MRSNLKTVVFSGVAPTALQEHDRDQLIAEYRRLVDQKEDFCLEFMGLRADLAALEGDSLLSVTLLNCVAMMKRVTERRSKA